MLPSADRPRFWRIGRMFGLRCGGADRCWVSSTGRRHGGKPYTQKYVHRLLTNVLYIGKIRHTAGAAVA